MLGYSKTVKLLTEHNLDLLSLKDGCTGSSESTLFKMPHCWKSHVTVHISFILKQTTNVATMPRAMICISVIGVNAWVLVMKDYCAREKRMNVQIGNHVKMGELVLISSVDTGKIIINFYD